MKKQTELAGFERESDRDLDELVALWLRDVAAKKHASEEERLSKEAAQAYMIEHGMRSYLYVDGEERVLVHCERADRMRVTRLQDGTCDSAE